MLRAARAIDRGDARRTLERLVSISTAEEFSAGARRVSDVAAPPPTSSATIVAATRRTVDGAPGTRATRLRLRAVPKRDGASRPGRFREALARPDRIQCHRRVQTPFAVTRRACARLRCSRHRARLRGAPARRPISVLTEPSFFDGSLQTLRPCRPAVSIPAPAQGLHRHRIPVARGARGRRRRGAAHRRGAAARSIWARCIGRRRELGLDVLVEVHSLDELAVAIDAGASNHRRQQPQPEDACGGCARLRSRSCRACQPAPWRSARAG